MRPKKGQEFWQRDKQIVIFYDIVNDLPIGLFESVWEIVDYRHLPRTKASYDKVVIELYNALRRPEHTTEMLGSLMTVYLIDIQENEGEES